MARNFLGFNDRGMLGFDLGDGAPPAWLPPTPDTTREAMRLESARGADPAAVLRRQGGIGLAGPVDPALAIPAAPSATGPTAMAQNQADEGTWDNPKIPDLGLHVPPAPKAVGDATVGIGLRPEVVQLGPSAAEVQKAVASGGFQAIPGQGAGLKQRPASESVIANSLGLPDPNAKPSTSVDPSKLVATPGQQGGAGSAPTGSGAPMGASAQEYQNWLKAMAIEEARKRPSAGMVIKGGKQQTGEQWQGALGPNADTVDAIRANAQETARMQKIQAEANAKRDENVAKIGQEQADYEAKAAEIQAQIAQRKQAALDGIGGQVQALQKKIASAEIDDGRWWGSKKASDKALIGIAVALDGVVRGLTGRVGQPNAVLQEVYRQQDRDIDMQIKNIDKQRGDLNDLQRVYVQTKEQFGDEALAADAAKLAGLAGFKAKIVAEAAKADAVQATDPIFKKQQLQDMAEMEAAYREAVGADTPSAQRAAEAKMQKLASMTRSYSVRAKLLELDADRKVLEQQAAIEERMNGTLVKSYGFTQDRYVGGSAGPDKKKIGGYLKEAADVESEQRKLGVTERDSANKGEKDQQAIFVNGQPVSVSKGASQPSVDRAQTRISYADDVISIVNTVENDKKAGRYIPGDPVQGMDALSLANAMAQMAGGGVASESDKADAAAALNPRDPRHSDAMARIRQRATAAKVNAAKSVGAKF